MHFKPDYAPDNLRANNYICHFSVFSRKLLEGEELFRTAFDGAQDHDMILRLTDRAQKIVHVPRLMYYWRSHAGSTAASIDAKPYAIEAAKGAVADHLKKHGFKHFQITSTRACATIFRIRYQILGDPKISIVIANKDHVEMYYFYSEEQHLEQLRDHRGGEQQHHTGNPGLLFPAAGIVRQ